MTILLDIDGVMVTTASWRSVEMLSDNFMKFNDIASANLQRIISLTNASIILTTTHRVSFSNKQWEEIFLLRGIKLQAVSKINEKKFIDNQVSRAFEIEDWYNDVGTNENFVIIDDDLSLNGLKEGLRSKCIITKPLIGLDMESADSAIRILLNQ